MYWIAESVPWYLVDPGTRSLSMTDEDYAMSSPERLVKTGSKEDAVNVLADHLAEHSRFGYALRGGESAMYAAASLAIRLGVDGVRISGRYYRIRKEV